MFQGCHKAPGLWCRPVPTIQSGERKTPRLCFEGAVTQFGERKYIPETNTIIGETSIKHGAEMEFSAGEKTEPWGAAEKPMANCSLLPFSKISFESSFGKKDQRSFQRNTVSLRSGGDVSKAVAETIPNSGKLSKVTSLAWKVSTFI